MAQTTSIPRHLPWWKTLLVVGTLPALVLAFGVGTIIGEMQRNNNPVGSEPSLPAMVRVVETPKPTPTPTPTPSPIAWPIVQVVWTLVTDLSILPPAEEGFYNGTMKNRPWGSQATEEWGTYAARIVSNRYGYTKTDLRTAVVAAARDPANKQIVLVGLGLVSGTEAEPLSASWAVPTSHLFLSLDGEETWTEVNLIPMSLPGATHGEKMLIGSTRIISQNGIIHLFQYAGDALIEGWWTATVP